ncbi:MAG: endonuclease III domain-containing protein [candidate division WOR-3 bacterium]
MNLLAIYSLLYHHFGPQNWWPAESPFEVIVGAVLTQNTAWENVQKAIANLKRAGLLNLDQISTIEPATLAHLIRPSGYFNIKAQRLLGVVRWLKAKGGLKKLARISTKKLREELLKCYGIGPETADSILLYAFNRPVFVVDAYTRRIFYRYGLISGKEPYEELRKRIENDLVAKIGTNKRLVVGVFNEFHALLVRLAKTYCRKKPLCSSCPLAAA